MLQQLKIYLRSTYSKLFPLDSFRRFVADQLLQSLYAFIYYGGVIAITIGVFLATLYFLGTVAEYLFGTVIKSAPSPLGSVMMAGFGASFALSGIIVLITVITLCMRDFDYTHWLKDQKSQALVANADITNYTRMTSLDRLLPIASLRKYLISRSIYASIIIIALVMYVILSVQAFKLIFGTPQVCPPRSSTGPTVTPCVKEDFPDPVIFLSSMGIQSCLFLFGSLIHCILVQHCGEAYAKHLRRARISTSKRQDGA